MALEICLVASGLAAVWSVCWTWHNRHPRPMSFRSEVRSQKRHFATLSNK